MANTQNQYAVVATGPTDGISAGTTNESSIDRPRGSEKSQAVAPDTMIGNSMQGQGITGPSIVEAVGAVPAAPKQSARGERTHDGLGDVASIPTIGSSVVNFDYSPAISNTTGETVSRGVEYRKIAEAPTTKATIDPDEAKNVAQERDGAILAESAASLITSTRPVNNSELATQLFIKALGQMGIGSAEDFVADRSENRLSTTIRPVRAMAGLGVDTGLEATLEARPSGAESLGI